MPLIQDKLEYHSSDVSEDGYPPRSLKISSLVNNCASVGTADTVLKRVVRVVLVARYQGIQSCSPLENMESFHRFAGGGSASMKQISLQETLHRRRHSSWHISKLESNSS